MKKIHSAMLPGGQGNGQDRWTYGSDFIAVLDGASSFSADVANADDYTDLLANILKKKLNDTDLDLRNTLAESIQETADALDVPAQIGPSSTVLIARKHATTLEVLALGDSTALVATEDGEIHRVTDSRLGELASDVRHRYRERLRNGSGYDNTHKDLLRDLQTKEAELRNTSGGYWIAESNPRAAHEAVIQQFAYDSVKWCVLTTDGAQRVIDYLDISWNNVADMSSEELNKLLQDLHAWEDTEDRHGQFLPRSKPHDDKTVVVWR